ncbi:MAG: hypothetical protein RSE18_00180 [Acinetobacter sp.]
MKTITDTVTGAIKLAVVGQEIYKKVAEYMDEMEKIDQSGADKKTRVMAYARSLILQVHKDWDEWKQFIADFIDAAKSIYNALRGIF